MNYLLSTSNFFKFIFSQTQQNITNKNDEKKEKIHVDRVFFR